MRKALRADWAGKADVSQQLLVWEGFTGIDLVTDNTRLAKNNMTYATNADFTKKVGAISRNNGAAHMFDITPPIRGFKVCTLGTPVGSRQIMFIANDTDIYVAKGGENIYTYSEDEDWDGIATDTSCFSNYVKPATGKLTGTWESPAYYLGDWVYELKLTQQFIIEVPATSSIVCEYALSADNSTWGSYALMPADGVPPLLDCYIKFKYTFTRASVDDSMRVSNYNFMSRTEFGIPTSVYSELTGNNVYFEAYEDKVYIAYGDDPLVYRYDGVIRATGCSPDVVAETFAVIESATVGLPSGDYECYITFVNDDGVEGYYGNDFVTTSSKKITWTLPVAVESANIVSRRLYRTLDGGSVFYLVTEIDNNTDTTYTDNFSDATLQTHELYDDTNAEPPDSSFLCLHNDVMFYVNTRYPTDVWYSKPGLPEYVPNTVSTQFYYTFPNIVTNLQSYTHLYVGGVGFGKQVTGSIFHSDYTVTDVTIKNISDVGAVGFRSTAIMNPQRGAQALAILNDSHDVVLLSPTLVTDIYSLPVISDQVSPMLINSEKWSEAFLFFQNRKLYVGINCASTDVGELIVCVFDSYTKQWQGTLTAPIRYMTATPWRTYAALNTGEIAYFLNETDVMLWGSRWGGYWGNLPASFAEIDVPFVVDTGYRSVPSTARARYRYLQLMVSGNSVTDNLHAKVTVDGVEQDVAIGSKEGWNSAASAGGAYGLGRQDAVISKLYPLNLPTGRFAGVRLQDTSNEMIDVYAIVLVCEPTKLFRGGL